MNYEELLKKYDNMNLYYTCVPGEYIVNIAIEVGRVMGIGAKRTKVKV